MRPTAFILLLTFSLITIITRANTDKNLDSLWQVYNTQNTDTGKAKALYNVAVEYENVSPDSSIYWHKKVIKSCNTLSANNTNKKETDTYQLLIASANLQMGGQYYYLSNFPMSIECFLKAVKTFEHYNDMGNATQCYNNIGVVQKIMGNYKLALSYYEKVIAISYKTKDTTVRARCYNNIGNLYNAQKNYKAAISQYTLALKLNNLINNEREIYVCYNNLGTTYFNCGKLDSSEFYYRSATELLLKFNDKPRLVILYENLGNLFVEKNDYKQAELFIQKGLTLADSIKYLAGIQVAYENFSNLYEKMGNTAKALSYYKKFSAIKDTILNKDLNEQMAELETKYNSEKKQLEIDKLAKEKQLQTSENKKQKIVIWFTIAGLLFVVVFAVFVVTRLRITRRQKKIIEQQKLVVDEKNAVLNMQNEEIKAQRDEIEAQRDEIVTQRDLVTEQKYKIETIHEQLKDSIYYAKTIQKAVMPAKHLKTDIPFDYFIFYKPKDIVSGDFYFIETRKNYLLIAVADCTGHGVPGAFMSMLGISLLHEIVAREKIDTPAAVLNELRQSIINSLVQKHQLTEGQPTWSASHDGMDIAFIAINMNTLEMQYAGANNSIYIIRQNNDIEKLGQQSTANAMPMQKAGLIEIKADKMPVSLSDRMNDFANQHFALKKNDMVYLFSDGFQDQMGGEKGKKFLSKNLKTTLLQISSLTLEKQKEEIQNTLEKWQNFQSGDGAHHEQTDDITIMGIKI